MFKTKFKRYERVVPDGPIYSKFDGTCKVCGKDYYKGELISPFFDHDYNFWRHTACLQLFFLTLQYGSDCNECHEELTPKSYGYWSKHNGIWCTYCGEKLFPNVSVAYSQFQKQNNFIRKNRKEIDYGK
ncbi:MAG: hypothetical protein VW930_02220 [Burkholderiaceae bacterium]